MYVTVSPAGLMHSPVPPVTSLPPPVLPPSGGWRLQGDLMSYLTPPLSWSALGLEEELVSV